MRFILSSSALNSRLSTLSKVINSKNALPILDCILFSIENGTLTLTASDSENMMKSNIALEESDTNGSFCVPNRTILDAVKELPEQPLTFEVNLETYTIKVIYQNGMYNFAALNADEFPLAQPMTDNATTITLDAATLNNNLNRSLFATAQDELRGYRRTETGKKQSAEHQVGNTIFIHSAKETGYASEECAATRDWRNNNKIRRAQR